MQDAPAQDRKLYVEGDAVDIELLIKTITNRL